MQSHQTTKIPTIKWAQRKDKIFLTIDAVEIKNPEIDIIDGKILKFAGNDKDTKYAFEIELFEEVDKEQSKYTLDSRNIFLNIQKTVRGPYWPRLTKNTQKLSYLGPDWRYYIDEDDEDEESNQKVPNYGGNEQNFPGFGGGDDEMEDEDDMPGFGGENGMQGFDGDTGEKYGEEHLNENKDHLDDLDKEESK